MSRISWAIPDYRQVLTLFRQFVLWRSLPQAAKADVPLGEILQRSTRLSIYRDKIIIRLLQALSVCPGNYSIIWALHTQLTRTAVYVVGTSVENVEIYRYTMSSISYTHLLMAHDLSAWYVLIVFLLEWSVCYVQGLWVFSRDNLSMPTVNDLLILRRWRYIVFSKIHNESFSLFPSNL